MEFNTFSYLIFLISLLILKFLLPEKYKVLLLLLGSFIFIASKNIESLLFLLSLASINFYLARKIALSSAKIKQFSFYLGITINIISIFVFKYFEQNTKGSAIYFSSINFDATGFVFALGLSFYALQNIAYLIEVYFNRLSGNISWLNYIFYSSFFPKLVSGPIVLPQEFFPQLNTSKVYSSDLQIGFQRIILGLFKKMVIADRLAPYVNYNFDIDNSNYGITALFALYLFTFQLYFDFSAYTDIAIGSAKMLGFELKENFKFPLRATSVTDFWRKWHVSLTSWLTKYVFYPFAYKLRNLKLIGTTMSIAITFLISGLWHGLGITFFVYALCHAFYLCLEYITKNIRNRISLSFPAKFNHAFGIIITFNLISFSFIFFRAESFNTSIQILTSIFNFNNFFPTNWLNDFIAKLAIGGDLESQFNLFITLILTILFLIFERKIFHWFIKDKIQWKQITCVIILIFLFGVFKSREQFIYVQF